MKTAGSQSGTKTGMVGHSLHHPILAFRLKYILYRATNVSIGTFSLFQQYQKYEVPYRYRNGGRVLFPNFLNHGATSFIFPDNGSRKMKNNPVTS